MRAFRHVTLVASTSQMAEGDQHRRVECAGVATILWSSGVAGGVDRTRPGCGPLGPAPAVPVRLGRFAAARSRVLGPVCSG